MKMSSDNIRIKIGPMSGGDLDTMYKFADKLVGAEKKGGYVITGYANAGDQNTILQKAMSLGLEFRPYIENVGSVTVDVFANATAQASGGKVFNVQVFDKPDVNSVLANNVPDGRYWCNETNVPLANLGGGFVGAEIVYEGKPAWIGIIPGATEIAPISQRDAYTRFVKNGNNGYTEAELAAAIEAATAKSKEQLAAEQKARQEAEAKIKAAQQALG